MDNLPSEVHHILQEIGHKEGRACDFRNRGASRDSGIQKHGRPQSQGGMGLLALNPKEEGGIIKIRNEFSKAEDLARDKVALAERGVNLVSTQSKDHCCCLQFTDHASFLSWRDISLD